MKYRIFYAVLISLCLSVFSVSAQPGFNAPLDSVGASVNYLRYFLMRNGNWFPIDRSVEKDLNGLLHYYTDDKLDTIIVKLDNYLNQPHRYLFQRMPQGVSDSLSVRGYVSNANLIEQLKRIDRSVKTNVVMSQIPVPQELVSNIDSKLDLVPADDADWLLRNSKITLPDSLKAFNVIPDSLINAANFSKYQRIEATRRAILEKARIEYNNKIRQQYIDSVSNIYRVNYLNSYTVTVQAHFRDSILRHNNYMLAQYNDSVMRAVNDSILKSVRVLLEGAKRDAIIVWLHNTNKDSVLIPLSNTYQYFTRLFIKNEQNDSLGVRVQNLNKNSLQFLIDDGVTLQRLSEKQKKELDLFIPGGKSNLETIQHRYRIITPWTLNAKSDLGLTQVAQENWRAGGKNSLSFMFVFNGQANYAKNNLTWRNTAQIRDGWIKRGDEKIEKNGDALQLASRFGLKAFKSWYYSAETDLNTQLLNGYNYPNRDNVISAFFAPAYVVFKIGMDYNLSKKSFSLLLSPLSAKLTYVGDTTKVNPARYNIPAGKKADWQSGFSADVNWNKNFGKNVNYITKLNMFVNYNSFPDSYDIRWENTFNVKVTNYISMALRFYLLYDDDVLFGTGKMDANGKEITETRWQFQEMISLNFTYAINKLLYRRKPV